MEIGVIVSVTNLLTLIGLVLKLAKAYQAILYRHDRLEMKINHLTSYIAKELDYLPVE